MTTNQTPSRDLAIQYALSNQWEDAYRENQKLLDQNPDSIETLNRTAYALVKLGKIKKAKELYQKVISMDKTNPIAVKNLKRVDAISKNKDVAGSASTSVNLQDLFIEEAGKTKTVDLKNVADKKTLSALQPGDPVLIVVKRSKVFIQRQDKTFIGMLPDSVGMRMLPLVEGGNEYLGFIKALGENAVTVFVKETKRMPKFKNYPSFVQPPTKR